VLENVKAINIQSGVVAKIVKQIVVIVRNKYGVAVLRFMTITGSKLARITLNLDGVAAKKKMQI
jgi:hypothetical protein